MSETTHDELVWFDRVEREFLRKLLAAFAEYRRADRQACAEALKDEPEFAVTVTISVHADDADYAKAHVLDDLDWPDNQITSIRVEQVEAGP